MMSATASQAAPSSMRPPSTACSASIECGGTRSGSALGDGPFWVLITQASLQPARTSRAEARHLDSLFRDDRQRDRDVDVSMQVNGDRVLAHHADRPGRQTHFAARHLEAGRGSRFRDIRSAHGTEQLAFRACLGSHAQLQVLHLFGPLLGVVELFLGLAFELDATRLELGDVVRRRERGLALRQQEIACKPRLDLDPVADAAQVGDFLEKDYFHAGALNADPCTAAARDSARASRPARAGAGSETWCR